MKISLEKYAVIAVLLLLMVIISSCQVEVVPAEWFIAADGATIYYTGINYSGSGLSPAWLKIVNNINSNIYSIYLLDPIDNTYYMSSDLLGPFDCIGAGRTNTIVGVPKELGDLKMVFSDDNTYAQLFTDLNFNLNNYTLTIDINNDTSNPLIASPTPNPNIFPSPTQSPAKQKMEKDGIIYTLTATPR
jgi:hypothetical protein